MEARRLVELSLKGCLGWYMLLDINLRRVCGFLATHVLRQYKAGLLFPLRRGHS